jgi:hypothetical protein
MLGEAELASPRAAGEREALRALMVARAGALAAKKAGLCQLRALVVTCPEPLHGELRSLTRAQQLRQPKPARAVAGVGPDQDLRSPNLRDLRAACRSFHLRPPSTVVAPQDSCPALLTRARAAPPRRTA